MTATAATAAGNAVTAAAPATDSAARDREQQSPNEVEDGRGCDGRKPVFPHFECNRVGG